MIRKQAIGIISSEIENNVIVAANGYISRDLFDVNDKHKNFYMIGSMGLSSSIALGVAIKNPKKRIFVFDGDGNILMNLGSLTTIGSLKPKNLIHVVFDNEIHESTGGQPTQTQYVSIKKLAKSANYKVFQASTQNRLKKILNQIKKMPGPIMIVMKIQRSSFVSKRVALDTIEIRDRFLNSLKDKH